LCSPFPPCRGRRLRPGKAGSVAPAEFVRERDRFCTMSRLVVVSNRVADPRKAAAGGLAVALGDSLNATGGLWFGWSGNIIEG
jgi:hypothetical protein